MPKKVVSFSLSETTIKTIEKISKALGMNRSEFIEYLLSGDFFVSNDVKKVINDVSKLQKEVKRKIERR